MPGEFVIGLDIGTTSAKAVIFQTDGRVIAEAEQAVKTYYPQQGWAEQDPEELERSAVKAIRLVIEKGEIPKEQVRAVGFSSAMHSLICVKEDGSALSKALIWSDGRSSEQAKQLLEHRGPALFARTGVPIHPMSPLTKLIWMKETKYTPYLQADYFMSVKEYMIMKWFGKNMADYSMAAATGMMNANLLDWDEEALELAGVDKVQMPEIVSPTEKLTGLSQEIADKMELSPQTPFIVGAADGQLANLGIGAILPGEVAITVGTSGAVRQFSTGFRINEKRETFCYAFTEESSIIGGPTNNGGIALQWLKDLIQYEGSYEQFLAEAAKVEPGADGVIFLPYVNGERAPIWKQEAKGNFYGLSVTHTREHLIRTVLEGITFNLLQINEALERLAGDSEKIYVNGGLARSPLWLQMLADIFGKEVYVAQTHHSSAWGAAWTALVGIGAVDSFQDIKDTVVLGDAYTPVKETTLLYKDVYKKYKELVTTISKHF